MTTERCEHCERPMATAPDWDLADCPRCSGDLADGGCTCGWDGERCWQAVDCAAHAIDWRTRARDEARRADAAETERDVLRARVAELRGALDEFGQHAEDCPGNTVLQRARGHSCDCGLVAVLNGDAP
jgi:hypothetical protein